MIPQGLKLRRGVSFRELADVSLHGTKAASEGAGLQRENHPAVSTSRGHYARY
jgi:hypothetical protein